VKKTRETVAEDRPEGSSGASGLALHVALCGDQPLFAGASFLLGGVREVVLGRGDILALSPGPGPSAARLEIADQTISSDHARIIVDSDKTVTVEDLGSRNGTRMRGKRISRATLAAGDWFVIGRTVLMLRKGSDVHSQDPVAMATGSLLRTFVPEFARTLRTAATLAPSAVPLLLVADTGTGKEVLAREIHALSGRTGRLVAVNCAAVPEALVESELFGFRRGSFSGAGEDRAGLVRSAEGGTLLLDEVGELPLPSQAKLLRFLQEGEILPLGATSPTRVDVRIIAATQSSFDRLVSTGRFRPDLLGRLAGYSLSLPKLADRREDMGLLVAALLARHAGTEVGRMRLTGEACSLLFERSWPLNVRELDRAIQSAVVLAGAERKITAEHLVVATAVPPSTGEPGPEPKLKSGGVERGAEPSREKLVESLRRHRGSVSAVAREFGKARMQIHRWMDRLEIDPNSFRDDGG
jgi:transcriptional regulator with PAS, ATPase and Fis domain